MTKTIISESVTLVIFTSEGREHLLKRTIQSFKEMDTNSFFEKILVVDGTIDEDAISLANPDTCLRQPKRVGYINSIVCALNHIETPYFFWLEDDFIFNQIPPLQYITDIIASDSSWAGIFLSRQAPLTENDMKHHYFDKLYKPDFGFSVSPSICNTKHVKNAFDALISYPKNDDTKFIGFEPFIDNYFVQNNLKYALIDPGQTAHVEHIGTIESTGREFHMINSISENKNTDKYLSGFGKEKNITSYNKLGMLAKLWFATFSLSFRLFTDRRSYDFAFRIYLAHLRKFKF